VHDAHLNRAQDTAGEGPRQVGAATGVGRSPGGGGESMWLWHELASPQVELGRGAGRGRMGCVGGEEVDEGCGQRRGARRRGQGRGSHSAAGFGGGRWRGWVRGRDGEDDSGVDGSQRQGGRPSL
jgi:hypothetical protein